MAEPDAERLAPHPLARPESRRVARFVVAGVVNTGLSVLIYQTALFVLPHTPVYVVSYVAGIAIAYVLYSRHVFDAPFNAARIAAFIVFYSVSLAAGALLNTVLIESLGIMARLAIFITIAAMLPLNYLGSRWCLRAD